jgi:hypothetical protein
MSLGLAMNRGEGNRLTSIVVVEDSSWNFFNIPFRPGVVFPRVITTSVAADLPALRDIVSSAVSAGK